MKKRYDSLVERLESLELENKKLKAINQLVLAEKSQWLQSREIQQQIVQQQLTNSNAEVQGYLEEIQLLKDEIKRLRDGG